MADLASDKTPNDPLGFAYEALKGADPLIQSAKQYIWRRIWARDNVPAWIKILTEIPGFSKSLHRVLPEGDLELLEAIKMVAERSGNSPSAFLISQLVNEGIERCRSGNYNSPRQMTASLESDDSKIHQIQVQPAVLEQGEEKTGAIRVPSAVIYPWIFDYTPLGVMKLDTQGNCEYANKKFISIVGASSFEGRNVRELFPDPKNRMILEEQLEKRFRERRADDYDIVLTRLDNGRRLHVRIASTPVLDSSGRPIGAIAIFRERTFERVIQGITQAISTSQTSHELLTAVSKEVRKLIPFDRLHVSIYSRDKKYVRTLFIDPLSDSDFKVRWFRMSPAMSKFAGNERMLRVDDMDEYFNLRGFIKLREEDLKKQGWLDRPRSLLRCPVARKGQVVASLSIGRQNPNSFSDSEHELFSSLPLREAVTMALYLEDKQNLKFRLELMGSIFTDWDDQEKVATVIVKELLKHHDWDHAAFFHVDEKSQEFRLLSQKAKNDHSQFLLPTDYTQKLNSGVLGFVYQNKRSVNIGDLAHSAQFKAIVQRGVKAKILSELCLPVIIDDRVCWVLNLQDSRENAFSSGEVTDLEAILDELKNLLYGVLSRHFLETTINSASDAIIAVDGAGCISRVNPAVKGLLGYSQDDLDGKSFLVILDAPGLLDEVTDGRLLSSEQVKLRHSDGTMVEVLLSASPLPRALGGAVFIARDLSLIKRLQELEYLGRIHRELAIQTKTPLSLAFSWLKTLHSDNPETVAHVVQELRKVELTYDRLALYEQHKGLLPTNKMLLDISEVIESVLTSLPVFERRKISVQGEAGIPWVRSDPYQLSFCFRTIVSYLLRFVPEEKHIDVQLTHNQGMVMIRINGVLPRFSEADLPGEQSDSIRRVLMDIALGEEILQNFITSNGGIYHRPRTVDQRAEFRIDLPARAEDTL